MQQVFEKIKFIVGDIDILTAMSNKLVFRAFDEYVIDFLSALSAELLSLRDAKKYSDVVTFAFWCRKANVSVLVKPYEGECRLGRGVVFHIAPSNVPINFAYSLVMGVIAGNANVVRIPSKDFPQTVIICKAIVKLLPEYSKIAERLCLVRYGHDKEVTDYISTMCSSRVIWGGDETVTDIRKSPLSSRANEITFPDRFSICVINVDKYLTDYDKTKVAKDFFNDTYLTDQNACTSPRIVFWFGTEREKAKAQFWDVLADLLITTYELQSVQAVNKLTTLYKFAAENSCKIFTNGNNKIVRVVVNEVVPVMLENLDNSGYFYECDIDNIAEILPICTRKLQTLSFVGFDPTVLREFVIQNAPYGIDRIVPVGKTMDFSFNWDGMDLIRTLSRRVDV